MESEKIFAVLKHFQKESVKNLIRSIRELKPDAIQSPLRFEELGDDLVISFLVDKKEHNYIVDKLNEKNVKILNREEKAKGIAPNTINYNRQSTPFGNNPLASLANKPPVAPNKPAGDKNIDDLVEKGNYKELFRLSKNLAAGITFQQTAKAKFRQTVDNAIEITYQKGLKSKLDFQINLRDLMEIASDKILKIMNMQEELKRAGLCCIDICTYDKNNFDELIKVANNSQILSIINLKAVIKFYDLTMHDLETYKEEVAEAVKKLNLRWLENAHLSSARDLTPIELGKYERFIKYVINTRNAEENEKMI